MPGWHANETVRYIALDRRPVLGKLVLQRKAACRLREVFLLPHAPQALNRPVQDAGQLVFEFRFKIGALLLPFQVVGVVRRKEAAGELQVDQPIKEHAAVVGERQQVVCCREHLAGQRFAHDVPPLAVNVNGVGPRDGLQYLDNLGRQAILRRANVGNDDDRLASRTPEGEVLDEIANRNRAGVLIWSKRVSGIGCPRPLACASCVPRVALPCGRPVQSPRAPVPRPAAIVDSTGSKRGRFQVKGATARAWAPRFRHDRPAGPAADSTGSKRRPRGPAMIGRPVEFTCANRRLNKHHPFRRCGPESMRPRL